MTSVQKAVTSALVVAIIQDAADEEANIAKRLSAEVMEVTETWTGIVEAAAVARAHERAARAHEAAASRFGELLSATLQDYMESDNPDPIRESREKMERDMRAHEEAAAKHVAKGIMTGLMSGLTDEGPTLVDKRVFMAVLREYKRYVEEGYVVDSIENYLWSIIRED